MSIIEVKNLKKDYKITSKKEGFSEYIKHLVKPTYDIKHAVNDVSFDINEGELVAYLGENGAGKSTTIKMMTGILTPTSGSVKVNGLVPYKERIKNNYNIGAVFGQKTQLWWDLPVIESYKLIQKMYKMDKLKYKQNLDKFIEILEIDKLLNVPVRNLSLGQKMKCELCATFLHDPKIVYLDEPTIGLDVLVKEKLRKFIKDINKQNHTTVILTTHDLQDVEEVCDRIIMIDKGTKIYDGTKAVFKDSYGKYKYVQFTVDQKSKSLKEVLKSDLYEVVEETTNIVKIKFHSGECTVTHIMNDVFKYCLILDIATEEGTIEKIIREFYRGQKENV